MPQLINIEQFAEKLNVTPQQAMRILNKNKFAKVKIEGLRRPMVNYEKWEKRKAS